MAEALLRQHGGDAFEVHSAGTEPKGINPLTLRVLAEAGIDASWARSKSVDEYLGQTFDYVVTVCDQARQACPVFPGVHESLHWGYEDPARGRGHRGGAAGGLPAGVHPDRRAGPAVRDRHPRARSSPDAAPPAAPRPCRRPGGVDGPDAARPLSDKGRNQAERLGRFLAGVGFAPDAIITLAQAAGGADRGDRRRAPRPRGREDERLAGASTSRRVEAILREAGDPERPMLVGHDPDFSELVDGAVRRGRRPDAQGRARADRGRPAAASRGRRDAALARPAGRCSSRSADRGFGFAPAVAPQRPGRYEVGDRDEAARDEVAGDRAKALGDVRCEAVEIHWPRRSEVTTPASRRTRRWCETVGWPTSQLAVKSHAQVSVSAASSRTMRQARRVGEGGEEADVGVRAVVSGRACHGGNISVEIRY